MGDCELTLRGLLDDSAPLSPASLPWPKPRLQLEYEIWNQEQWDGLEAVYV